MRRTLKVVLVVGLAAVGVAWAVALGTTWASGKLPDDHTVLGLPAFWWGRAGKALQLLAGLAILVDLTTSDGLTRWATRAQERAAWRATLERFRSWRGSILSDFVQPTLIPTGTLTAVYDYGLRVTPPGRVPENLALSLEQYRGFHQQTVRQVDLQHGCCDSHRASDVLCDEQVAYLVRCVTELAKESVAGDDRDQIDDAEKEHAGSAGSTVWMSLALPFCVVGFASPVAASVTGLPLLPIGLACFVLMVPGLYLAFLGEREALRIEARLYLLQQRLATWLLSQAGQIPPFRSLKLWALRLFVIGAFLDLFVS